MKKEDLDLLIKKMKLQKAKKKPWMDAMPNSSFWLNGSVQLEVNTSNKSIKRLNDFEELSYLSSSLEKITKLLKGEKIE